jgi:hypothetical protein
MRLEKKSFSSPDEVRPMSGMGQVEILNVGDGVVGKATFEPGWRWSEHVKPLAGPTAVRRHTWATSYLAAKR